MINYPMTKTNDMYYSLYNTIFYYIIYVYYL